MIEIYCDGICEPNPGFACWAWIAKRDGEVIDREYGALGAKHTNNDAEYVAVGKALRWLYDRQETDGDGAIIRTDSQLVVKQVHCEWECKVERLRGYLRRINEMLEEMEHVAIEWIPAAENGEADELTRIAYREATGKEAPVRHKAQGR